MYNNYTYEKSQSKFINNTLLYMAVGLILTFLTAYFVAATPSIAAFVYSSGTKVFSLAIVQIGLVVLLSRRINRMSFQKAIGLFIVYSILNGLTFSSIFIVFELTTVISVFVVAAAMFFCCSMIGITSRRDLSTLGRIAIMGVVGLILATILNYFIGSDQMSSLINYAGVLIFCILTAYDMQKVKHMHQSTVGMGVDTAELNKYAVIAALQLYLDFINLFIYLIRIFADRD